MQIELSGPNLEENIDEKVFLRWMPFLSAKEREAYRKMHELIADGVGEIDARMLADACGTSRNNLFKVILPRLQSLGLCYFGSDDD
jgi:hypothetical protein